MSQEQKLQDILEIVQFMQNEMATKETVRQEIGAVRQEVKKNHNELVTHLDGFVGLHQKLDIELTSLRSFCNRLQDQIHQLAKAQDVTLR